VTTTSRPSAARKHTRTTEKKATDELEKGIRITLDGEAYEVRLADVTSTLARELRRATGMSFTNLMDEIMTAPDADSIAGFVWLARRLAGEKVDVDDVVITYAQLLSDGFDVDVPERRAEKATGDPEA
jgi:hypothetical protein